MQTISPVTELPETIVPSIEFEENIMAHEWDNEIQFKEAAVAFEMEGHTITDGQPFDGITIKDDTLDIKAGRKSGHEAAATFEQNLKATNMFGLDVDFSRMPTELHFTVYGNMTFTFTDDQGKTTEHTCKDFRIA